MKKSLKGVCTSHNLIDSPILCLQVSVLIIHWHCFQVSFARAQLAKDINLYQKELWITFRRNIRNMLIIGLCHRQQ